MRLIKKEPINPEPNLKSEKTNTQSETVRTKPPSVNTYYCPVTSP